MSFHHKYLLIFGSANSFLVMGNYSQRLICMKTNIVRNARQDIKYITIKSRIFTARICTPILSLVFVVINDEWKYIL